MPSGHDGPWCRACCNTKVVPHVEPGVGSWTVTCPQCGRQSWYDTIMQACTWHERNKDGKTPMRGDVQWARGWLASHEKEYQTITADQAAAIRAACGWVVQLGLFGGKQ